MTTPTDLAIGDYVVDSHGAEWVVTGLSRYAPGRVTGGRRVPGIAVRPASGGRARVIAAWRIVGRA